MQVENFKLQMNMWIQIDGFELQVSIWTQVDGFKLEVSIWMQVNSFELDSVECARLSLSVEKLSFRYCWDLRASCVSF